MLLLYPRKIRGNILKKKILVGFAFAIKKIKNASILQLERMIAFEFFHLTIVAKTSSSFAVINIFILCMLFSVRDDALF